jgi:two-component system nitrate/nitrite response regulator NarL
MRVLIVDDQPVFRRQLRRLFTFAGLRVVGEAGTIAEAEAQLRAQEPDLAVVDLILPGVDGIEGIARLKALAPDLRVILVSVIQAHVELIRAAAVEAGAEDFLPKEDLTPELVRLWKV